MSLRTVIILVGSAIIVPLIMILASGFGNDPHAVPFVLQGKKLPPVELVSLDGQKITLGGEKTKPIVVNFWSTWCEPCKAEHLLLQEAAKALNNKVEFYGVIYQDTPEKTREYLQQKGSEYPHLLDPNSSVAMDFGITGVPETVFMSAEGIVLHKHLGVLTPPILFKQLSELVPGGLN